MSKRETQICLSSWFNWKRIRKRGSLVLWKLKKKIKNFKGQVFWVVFGLCVNSLMNEVQGIELWQRGKGVSETTQFCMTSFMNGPLRSAGPGGFSPFFSWGGIKLLCSQEFIWEMEFTQFIRDLRNKTKSIEGIGPQKNITFITLGFWVNSLHCFLEKNFFWKASL